MLAYIIRRILGMIPTMILISFICFVIIQLRCPRFLHHLIEQSSRNRRRAGQRGDQSSRRFTAWISHAGAILALISGFPPGFWLLLGMERSGVGVVASKLAYTIFLGCCR
jgi:peptide/nickel transport system permease protein